MQRAWAAVAGVAFLLSTVGAVSIASGAGAGVQPVANGMMGPGGMGHRGMMGPGMMHRGNVIRHRYVRRNGIPLPYRTLRNPLPPTPENVRAGGELYTAYCASCHGPGGRGDGPAAAGLQPPPADLTWTVRSPFATDPFFYWTMAEGGRPVGSAMPAFKEVLNPQQAWRIILFVRQL